MTTGWTDDTSSELLKTGRTMASRKGESGAGQLKMGLYNGQERSQREGQLSQGLSSNLDPQVTFQEVPPLHS